MNKNNRKYSISTVRKAVEDFNKSGYPRKVPTKVGGEIPPCGKFPLAIFGQKDMDTTKAAIELYPELEIVDGKIRALAMVMDK